MSTMKSGQRGPRGPYAKTQAVRERILDGASAEFAEVGYQAATMKAIAARADISERGLSHHFKSKDELRDGLLTRREESSSATFPRQRGLDGLLALWQIVLEDSRTRTIAELQTSVIAEAVSPAHPQHGHQRKKYDDIRRYATSAFAALAADGDISSSLKPEELAAIYVAVLDGLQVQWLYNPAGVDPAAVARRFLEAVIPRLRDEDVMDALERDATGIEESGSAQDRPADKDAAPLA